MTAKIVLVPGAKFQLILLAVITIAGLVAGWAAGNDIWWLMSIFWFVSVSVAALYGHGACARMLALTYPELLDEQ